MPRTPATPSSGPSDERTPDAAIQAFVEQLFAEHGGDPRAVWSAMSGPGGFIEQALAAGGAPSGTAFGMGSGDAGGLAGPTGPLFERLVPERRFTLPDPPAQVSTLRVRIDIDDARPPIWRRVELAGDITLQELDLVIQSVFGWLGYHLHMFVPEIDGTKDLRVRPFPNDGTDEFCDSSLPHEGLVRLDQVVRDAGDRLFYEYDFGDSWHHTLKVEKVLPRAAGDPRGVCLGGRRAGPPEDVGGIWHYNEVVAALAGDEDTAIDQEEMAQLRDWLGDDFDPAEADLDEVDLDGLLRAQGTALRWAPLLPGNPRLSDHCGDLVRQAELAGALPVLAPWFAAAGLDLTVEPPAAAKASVLDGLTAQEAEAVLLPWRTFLSAIGPDGAELTAAGYLRPVVVETLFTSLGMESEWIGKGNREDLTPPVARLRQAATALGIVRKYKGRLVPVKALAGASDPIRLWRHVADHLTRGRERFQRHCAVLALLVIAGDGATEDGASVLPVLPPDRYDQDGSVQATFRAFAGETLGLLGWMQGMRPPGGWDARHASDTVWVAFEHPACITPEGRVTPAGRRLARAALLAG